MDRVQEIVSELAPDLKELTLKIHDNPELGNQEHKACRWQMELLQKYGFETSDNFCDIPTAYKAVYKGKKPGPKIAMLAEYDALPELGHGCGHNLIAMNTAARFTSSERRRRRRPEPKWRCPPRAPSRNTMWR